jgi:hypothetical protein
MVEWQLQFHGSLKLYHPKLQHKQSRIEETLQNLSGTLFVVFSQPLAFLRHY